MDVLQVLINRACWSREANMHISKFKWSSKQVNSDFINFRVLCPWFFCHLRFQFVFDQNFSWTSAKTLIMESVDPEGKTDAFLVSNEPQRRYIQILPYPSAIFHGFLLIRIWLVSYQNFSWMSIKTSVKEPVGPKGLTYTFSSSNES